MAEKALLVAAVLAAIEAAAERAVEIVLDRTAISKDAAFFANNFRLAREIGRLCGIDPGDAFFRTFVRNELDEANALTTFVRRTFFARRHAVDTTIAIGMATVRHVSHLRRGTERAKWVRRPGFVLMPC